MSSVGINSVNDFTAVIEKLLTRAREIKSNGGMEPALTTLDLAEGLNEVEQKSLSNINRKYAAIETACRNIFYDLLCEPSLLFWLVEELLDTQTIDGCRIVFDYLDSRRERITAKHFKQKNLIILRACNELLRRLSRAEDTVFCGRVFIFLFQSFPLGDRSSVNLRGEYHVENITVYEDQPPKSEANAEDGMAIDQKENEDGSERESGNDGAIVPVDQPKNNNDQTDSLTKTAKIDGKDEKIQDEVPDMDTLYPVFWSLQENFATPTKLFEDTNLQAFKSGLEKTIEKFKQVQEEFKGRVATKIPDDRNRGIKRKRNGQEDQLASSFNPKYLTSRDLFDLEISDLAFQRHILVQALILVDFLLSLTPKAKKKLDHTSNKSVLYNYTLSEECAKWATTMRNTIATYLQEGPEGKFYYRMVDTVLSRDKNWVHWKAEGCPLIERDPVSAEDFAEAEKGAQKACTNKRLRPMPMGSLDLAFLSDGGDVHGMERLKDPESIESFERPLADDDFDIDMAKDAEEKQRANDARASKLWRTLRIASKSKLNLFDRIDDGSNLKALFQPEGDENKDKTEANGSEENSESAGKDNSDSVTEEKSPRHSEQKAIIANGVDAPRVTVVK
ncbi:THO complex subunit 1, partial [Lecanoromycetidae sp. Uapishka_2]